MLRDISHPDFCPRIRCLDDAGGVVVHREPARTVVTPAADPTQPVQFRLVQCDELDAAGQQVEHDPEVEVLIGEQSVLVLGLDDFSTILSAAAQTHTRGCVSRAGRGYRPSA